ncbi:MAG: hypothetical protein M1819_003232 [Sarea resinae]|nr:MAG: hypothetical protein M1819_003232 [Sarea resinae]
MSPLTTKPIYFGAFLVTPQVFHLTPLSFALVNLKPLLPGHVLVSPLRRVPRVSDLTPSEASDLFLEVQRVGRMVERVFGATSLNIAIQDGVDAGQSVDHVHAHVIPRKKDDLGKGGTDRVYSMLEGDEGDVGAFLEERKREREREAAGVNGNGEGTRRAKFPVVDDAARKPRGEDEMRKEAEWLAKEMEADEKRGSEAGEIS